MRGLPVRGQPLLLPETDLLAPPPSPLSGDAYAVCGEAASALHATALLQVHQAKALKDLHKSGHDPEVLKELRTATDLTLRATKVTASSLGLSCPHLWSRSATSGCVWST